MRDRKNLGKRIQIIGFSASGKSTLAHYLSKRLNYPVHYIDNVRSAHSEKKLSKMIKQPR